ncbi:potassium channel family protein [Micromonospora sp. CPCC 205371]|nr:potassium channel family protein [Micromonospora sp. CPCC 205371]
MTVVDLRAPAEIGFNRRYILLIVSNQRLSRYEQRTKVPLIALAIAFLAAYAWPILDPELPPATRTACAWAGVAIWIIFGLDYLIRLGLTDRRLAFIRRNWFDVAILALPMLRPLRLLRGVIALRAISRGGVEFARGKVVASIAAAVATAGAVAALALLDAERANPDANVRNYGDAIWWAISTITTVGYGDRYPTTAEGRLIAAALMISGIALLGVITASLASWFVERVGEVARVEQTVQAKLDVLAAEVHELRDRLDQPDVDSDHLDR